MKRLALFMLICLVTFEIQAQIEIPKLPEIIDWNNTTELAAKEEEVIELLDWLVNTPLSEHVIERSELSYFVLEWLTRTPSVSITLRVKPYESDFLQTEDMLLTYIEGSALYALKHKGSTNEKNQDLAGLKAVAFMAETSKSYYDSPKYKDLVRAVKKGHLDELYEDYNKQN